MCLRGYALDFCKKSILLFSFCWHRRDQMYYKFQDLLFFRKSYLQRYCTLQNQKDTLWLHQQIHQMVEKTYQGAPANLPPL